MDVLYYGVVASSRYAHTDGLYVLNGRQDRGAAEALARREAQRTSGTACGVVVTDLGKREAWRLARPLIRPCPYCWQPPDDWDPLAGGPIPQPDDGFAPVHLSCEDAIAAYMEDCRADRT